MKKYTSLNDNLYQYIVDSSVHETEELISLREKTQSMPGGHMQIPPDQGQLLAMLIKISGASRVLEIGTFTGYSALVMALALPEDGKLTTCDIDNRNIELANSHWEKSNVKHKIDFKLGDARKTLAELIDAKKQFDFIFIDADKRTYEDYCEQCLTLLKQNGIIAIDNVLQNGNVIDPNNSTPAVKAIRDLNKKLQADSRVELSMLSIADGLTLLRKL
jgi:predicted O-methyltransferase YrrM